MTITEIKNFLRNSIEKEAKDYYGLKNNTKNMKLFSQITENWFNDFENYDRRWQVIKDKVSHPGKVLDMASGCGTFILYGLHHGYNVWGVEPEEWKRKFFHNKIIAAKYPENFQSRMIFGIGEDLPFEDNSFDLVTTYQTLEHVSNVNKCLEEMLRVLKPGGVLYIRAPDYNSFFEPHYRLPFLPKMNKKLASIYLKLLGRPLLGLQYLNWVTTKDIVSFLKVKSKDIFIENLKKNKFNKRKIEIEKKLPKFLKYFFISNILNLSYEFLIKKVIHIFREEENIELWITKPKIGCEKVCR